MSDLSPLVSIIVPVYNVEKYLRECLDSLVNQTLTNIEIICINDASPDNSLAILKEYADKDKRIVIIDLPENRRQGGARNCGIKIAKADYISFVDSDDFVPENRYEKMLTTAHQNNYDLVVSNYYKYKNGKLYKIDNIHPEMSKLPLHEQHKWVLRQGLTIPSNLYKKEIFIKNNLFFPEKLFYEDNAIAAPLFFLSENIAYLHDYLYYYRVDNISTTRSINNLHFFDGLETAIIFMDNMKRIGKYDEYKEEINYFFVNSYYIGSIWGALTKFTQPQKNYIKKIQKSISDYVPEYISYVNQENFVLRLIIKSGVFMPKVAFYLIKCKNFYWKTKAYFKQHFWLKVS